MADFEIIDTDFGMKSAIAQFSGLDGYELLVGIFEGSTVGEFAANSGKNAGMDEGKRQTLIAEYAGLHEFGSDGGQVSEKRWFRDALDANKSEFDNILNIIPQQISDGKKPNNMGVLMKLGAFAQGEIRKSITRKGLVDTGAMRWAVRFEIKNKGGVVKGNRLSE